MAGGAARGFFALTSLVLIAGAIVLIFFVLLAGAVHGSSLSNFWFLEVDTSNISGAMPISRWTFWNVAGVDDNGNTVFNGVSPDFPFDPARNFPGASNVPASFLGTNMFYYLSRFTFPFVLIALFFAVMSLFLGIFALCSRIGSYLSSVMCFLAMLFQVTAASLMTANFVIGRNNFMANGQVATIGRYNFGFMWAAFAALFIATTFFCLGGAVSKNDGTGSRFGRKKNHTRGSFIDNESQRPVVNNAEY